MIELDEITGIFVGQWEDRNLYAVYYTGEGYEYLARMVRGEWQIVSWKDESKVETELQETIAAPHPITVAYDLISDELLGDKNQIVI